MTVIAVDENSDIVDGDKVMYIIDICLKKAGCEIRETTVTEAALKKRTKTRCA